MSRDENDNNLIDIDTDMSENNGQGSNFDEIISDLNEKTQEVDKKPQSLLKNRKIRKHYAKKQEVPMKLLKVIFLFIYKTGLMIEHAVSYANHKGISRILVYISTIFVFLFRISKKYLAKLGTLIHRTSRFWVPACAFLIVLSLVLSSTTYALAVKVSVDNELVGYVEQQTDFETVKTQVESDIANKVGDSFSFDKLPIFSFSIVKKNELSNTDEVYSSLYKKAEEALGQTYGIFVDGTLIGAYPKEGPILDLLEELKKPYQSDASDETVEFIKKVELVRNMYARTSVLTLDELRSMLLEPKDNTTVTIQKGDTASAIAKKYKLSTTQLKLLNPGKDMSSLVKGQTLFVSKPAVELGIKVVKTISYTETIKFQSVKTVTADLFEGSTKVKSAGSNGLNEFKARVTIIDGIETKREITEQKTTKQPVTEQLLVGSKKIAPSGHFIWPVPNSRKISSQFGYRGREFHPAIDIPAPIGTPIVAADAGTVVHASRDGGYGLFIIIDHGNGVRTSYGHCSKILVSVGQKVYQGQQIGNVGSTGRSTGAHCHFEMTNPQGVTVNPLKYVG